MVDSIASILEKGAKLELVGGNLFVSSFNGHAHFHELVFGFFENPFYSRLKPAVVVI